MPADRLFDRLLLTDDMSPLPSTRDFMNVLDMAGPDVELVEHMRLVEDGTHATVTSGASWPTTVADVAEAYEAQLGRLLDYLCCLSRGVDVITSHIPSAHRADVRFRAALPPAAMPLAHVSQRMLRRLADAVRTTGKQRNPRGARVIDLDHWTTVANDHAACVGEDAGEHLAVCSPFLTVLVEWFRAASLASGRRRRVLRADLGLDAELGGFGRLASSLAGDVGATLEALARAPVGTSDLAFHRASARAVLELQDRYPQAERSAGLQLLFVERISLPGFAIAAAGLSIPPPGDGYAVRLRDGAVAYLPQPPWSMAWRMPPPARDEGSG